MSIEIEGNVENEEFLKEDRIKATKILGYSLLSALFITIILYYLPI